MGSPSTRMLELLSLLESRRSWNGPELAAQLAISHRTLRRDVDRLRKLGYLVESSRGTGGSYRLRPGRGMPPLMLSYEEAVATAVGLRHVAADHENGGRGGERYGERYGEPGDGAGPASAALRKIEQILPTPLRPRIEALLAATERASADGSADGGKGAEGGGGDGDLAALGRLASAVHTRSHVRFQHTGRDGTESERRVEPYRQVLFAHRWYLLGWDLDRADWRTFRLDRVRRVTVPGTTFAPRPLPDGDGPPEGPQGAASVLFMAPAAVVARTLTAQAGTLHDAGGDRCRYVTRADDWDWLAGAIAAVGVPYAIERPDALARATRRLADRAADAAMRHTGR